MFIFNTSGPQSSLPSPSKSLSVLHTASWLANASLFFVDSQFNAFYLTPLHLSLTVMQRAGRTVKVHAFYRSKLALLAVPGCRALLTGMRSVYRLYYSASLGTHQSLAFYGGWEKSRTRIHC